MQDDNKKKLHSPIIFHESEYKINPLQPFDRLINGRNKFAITATTGNGKYVRDGYLFYKMNGIEIYAELNSILMINTVDKTVFIKTDKKLSESISPSDPELIEYVILYTDLGYEDGDEPFRWVKVQGRTNAYNNIKDNATLINIDLSCIISESVALKDALSIREFCEYLKNANVFSDDDFDINDYAGTDYL